MRSKVYIAYPVKIMQYKIKNIFKFDVRGVSKQMQPINMMIYYWDNQNGSHFEHVLYKNASFELETLNQCFFNCYYISFQDMQSFFEFLFSEINPYLINGLHLFWDSFEWFCL